MPFLTWNSQLIFALQLHSTILNDLNAHVFLYSDIEYDILKNIIR